MDEQKKNVLEHAFAYLLNRLKEPSTWAGLAVFVGFFGLDAATIDRIVHNGPAIVAALASAIAIFAPSSKLVKLVTAQGDTVVTNEPSGAPKTSSTVDLVDGQ